MKCCRGWQMTGGKSMKDLIDRQAAIDAMSEALKRVFPEHRQIAEKCLNKLPDAQPQSTMGQVNDTAQLTNDCISRQAAIDALRMDIDIIPYAKAREYARAVIETVYNRLEHLPAAQPETAKRIVGKSRGGMTLWYQCDMCNEPVDAQDNFCCGCGRRLIDG